MKKTFLISAMGLAAVAAAPAANAQEVGRVISSTPVIQQVAVQRHVCNTAPVAVEQPNSGGGAVLGAIVGGVIGNQIGHGMGRAAATGVGMVAGAAVGNSVEGSNYPPQFAQQCGSQTSYENRTVGYNVQYEYAGKQHSVQMPYDPGATIRLQVSPMAGNTMAPAEGARSSPSGTPVGVILAEQPSTMYPAYTSYPAYEYPAYAYPAYPGYYARPYYAPIGLSLGFGYYGGHRRWR